MLNRPLFTRCAARERSWEFWKIAVLKNYGPKRRRRAVKDLKILIISHLTSPHLNTPHASRWVANEVRRARYYWNPRDLVILI